MNSTHVYLYSKGDVPVDVMDSEYGEDIDYLIARLRMMEGEKEVSENSTHTHRQTHTHTDTHTYNVQTHTHRYKTCFIYIQVTWNESVESLITKIHSKVTL